MRVIDGIKLCAWCLQHNENGKYDNFINFMIKKLNDHLNEELYLRGYRTDRI